MTPLIFCLDFKILKISDLLNKVNAKAKKTVHWKWYCGEFLLLKIN